MVNIKPFSESFEIFWPSCINTFKGQTEISSNTQASAFKTTLMFKLMQMSGT